MSMSDKAILKGKEVIEVSNLREWGMFFENKESRRVAVDEVNGARVSTVFLGVDHSWGYGPKLWFETMIFGGEHDGFQDRYTTWDEAEAGHKRVVEALKKGESP